jgi:hypothetical protein
VARGWKVCSVKNLGALRQGVYLYRAQDQACCGIAKATTGKRLIAVGSRDKTSVEPIAGCQDGSRRSLGFLGSPDPLSSHSWSVRARLVSDHHESASRIAPRLFSAAWHRRLHRSRLSQAIRAVREGRSSREQECVELNSKLPVRDERNKKLENLQLNSPRLQAEGF